MTEILNFNRIGLLLQRYFVENRHRELYYWGIFIIVFMFTRNNPALIGAVFIIAGANFCGNFFREIHSPTAGLNYFMIPATQAEKLVTSFLVTIFYYFGMMLLVYVIGNLVGTLLNNLFANISFLSSSLKWFSYAPLQWSLLNLDTTTDIGITVEGTTYLWAFFKSYIFTQAVFTLGSLYFKRSAVFKTLLTLFVVGFVYVVIMGLGMKGIFDVHLNSGISMRVSVNQAQDPFETVTMAFMYLLIPYLWVLSYFKLTEKEV